ncbi:DivIVA domain-containing protein [Streptomyces sp. 549]|uniref:DivIVA domain-containing protein n=1 Tax=Streptomyces sp. 549 TaxID=3049076 RepID=UPI0024C33B3E|nr:DivIVA domain-containing protein [Streptomyces sp. 549]MDK1476258.1 DivIVA domain-containing protein [Streptomyces sp. 549]
MARSGHLLPSHPEVNAVFWFLLIAMLAVVGAVTLAVVGSGDGSGRAAEGGLHDAEPDRVTDPLPEDRPVGRGDVDALRLPLALRGYRMAEVDDVLDRLGAELAERDARIAELESALAGAQAAAMGRGDLFDAPGAPGIVGGNGRDRGNGGNGGNGEDGLDGTSAGAR